jgi:hypothetical protein
MMETPVYSFGGVPVALKLVANEMPIDLQTLVIRCLTGRMIL